MTRTPPAAPPNDTGARRKIPLGSKIAAGVAGAGLISAVVWTKIGLADESDFKNHRAMGTATRSEADRVERDQNLINLSWGVTGAAAITAVVIYFVAPAYTTDTKSAMVVPTDGGIVASFARRF
jgi:hypothetical protein